MLVAEGHWLKRQDRFARLVHWLNRFLETRRRCGRAEMTSSIYDNCYTCRHGCPTNSGDKCGTLIYPADTNRTRLTSHARDGDVDVSTAASKIDAGLKFQCDIVAAGCVGIERNRANCRIELAGRVVNERTRTCGRIVPAGCVVKNRIVTDGRVEIAVGVAIERTQTDGGVVEAKLVAIERLIADGRVVAAAAGALQRLKTDSRVVDASFVQECIITQDGVLVS